MPSCSLSPLVLVRQRPVDRGEATPAAVFGIGLMLARPRTPMERAVAVLTVVCSAFFLGQASLIAENLCDLAFVNEDAYGPGMAFRPGEHNPQCDFIPIAPRHLIANVCVEDAPPGLAQATLVEGGARTEGRMYFVPGQVIGGAWRR